LLERIARAGSQNVEPASDYPALIREMHRNLLVAVLARSRSDWGGAYGSLYRNAVLAESLWSSTDPFKVRLGAGAYQALALGPAAALAELRGDSARAGALRDVGAELQGYLTLTAWDSHLAGFAANPNELEGLKRAAALPAIPLAYRLATLVGLGEGFCLNPGEVLAGPAPSRILGLPSVSAAIGDPAASAQAKDVAGELQSLSRPFPPGAFDRLRYCVRLVD
jgi:hypothetical protein